MENLPPFSEGTTINYKMVNYRCLAHTQLMIMIKVSCFIKVNKSCPMSNRLCCIILNMASHYLIISFIRYIICRRINCKFITINIYHKKVRPRRTSINSRYFSENKNRGIFHEVLTMQNSTPCVNGHGK